MSQLSRSLKIFAAPGLVVLLAATAHAQASRTWVSGVGDDANPCSRTAPCKTFAGAISKTAPGGEIDALDPGGFGAVTITKSITLRGDGTMASVLVAGSPGISVFAGATDVVVLDHLHLQGLAGNGANLGNAGTIAVNVGSIGSLTIKDCFIQGFSQSGINFTPNATANLVVADTIITETSLSASTNGGVYVAPSGGGVTFLLDNVRITNNGNFGVQVSGASASNALNGEIRNSNINQSGGPGVFATSSSQALSLMVDGTTVSNNTTNGIQATGAMSTVRVSNSVITNNNFGVRATLGGTTVSFGNNTLLGNVTNDGTFTTTTTTK